MKKILYALAFIGLFPSHAFSQDKIHKKNGEILEVKVLEIGEAEIKYKIFNDLDGPIYSVDKDRLLKIIYQNGREETYRNSLKDETLYMGQAKKALKINFLSPLLGYTQLSFEKNIRPGRSHELTLGIIGLGQRQKTSHEIYEYDQNDYTSFTKETYRKAAGGFIGAGYKFVKMPNFYKNGDKYSHILQGAYAKPEIILGIYNQDKYFFKEFYDQQANTTTEKETVVLGALVINIGKQWVLGDFFLLDLYGGLGYVIDNQKIDNIFENYEGNHFSLNVAGDSGIGFSGGLKVGILINKKKIK